MPSPPRWQGASTCRSTPWPCARSAIPGSPEYALGAAAPGRDGIFIRSHDGLDERLLGAAIARAKASAEELDDVLHGRRDLPV